MARNCPVEIIHIFRTIVRIFHYFQYFDNFQAFQKIQTAVPRLTLTLLVAQRRERVRRRTNTFPEKAWGGAMPSFIFFRPNGGPEVVRIFRTKCPDFPDRCPDFPDNWPDFPDIFHILWKFSILHSENCFFFSPRASPCSRPQSVI